MVAYQLAGSRCHQAIRLSGQNLTDDLCPVRNVGLFPEPFPHLIRDLYYAGLSLPHDRIPFAEMSANGEQVHPHNPGWNQLAPGC